MHVDPVLVFPPLIFLATLTDVVPFCIGTLDLIITTLYVFLVAATSNDSKVPIERIGNSRCAEEPSGQEHERAAIRIPSTTRLLFLGEA